MSNIRSEWKLPFKRFVLFPKKKKNPQVTQQISKKLEQLGTLKTKRLHFAFKFTNVITYGRKKTEHLSILEFRIKKNSSTRKPYLICLNEPNTQFNFKQVFM